MNKKFLFLSFIFVAIFFCQSALSVTSCPQYNVYTSCVSGRYLYNAGCEWCPTNATCAGGTATFLCNSGWYKSGQGCVCNIGYYGTLTCQACPTGSTTSGINSQNISDCFCTSGYYGPGGSSGCTECPANTASCSGTSFSCNIGFYKNAVGTDCTQCPSGSTTSGTGAIDISACKCSVGYYMNGSACQPCPANSTTASTGSTNSSDCKCLASYYGVPNTTGCTSCASGTGNSSATSTFGENGEKSKCYLLPTYSGNDGSGTYGYSANCPYSGS